MEQPGSRDPSNTVSYAVGARRREAVCITLEAGLEVELCQPRNQAPFSGPLERRLGRLWSGTCRYPVHQPLSTLT